MELEQLVEIKKGETGKGLLIENDGYISINDHRNSLLKESVDAFQNGTMKELPRPFSVYAVFQKFDIENANGRIYPENILKREAEKYQEKINNRTSYGECNHPEDSNINLERLAMHITELHWEGHTLVGKLTFPITEAYRRYGMTCNLADLMAHWVVSGLRIGVSSRGVGTVTQQYGKLIVGDDYEIICWDVVSNPSTPNAYIEMENDSLKPYIQENVDIDTNKKNLLKESEKNDKFSEFIDWLNEK